MVKKKSKKRILIIIVAIVIVVLLAGLIAIPIMIMNPSLNRRYDQEQYIAEDYGITAEAITLETSDDLQLAAWRTKAINQNSKGTVIIVSGIQNPSVTAFFGYAKMLSDNGWDSLLIEMRARSLSEGEEIGLGLTEWHDIIAGVDYLENDPAMKDLPIVAMGTSMGAATCITATGEDERIDGTISISGFSTWPDVFVDNMQYMGLPKFLAVLEKPFIGAYVSFHYGFDVAGYTPIKAIKKFGNRPLLLMQSTNDSQVPYQSFERLSKQARKSNVNLTAFIRYGDEHFICYDEYSDEPTKDIEFSSIILNFLEVNFS